MQKWSFLINKSISFCVLLIQYCLQEYPFLYKEDQQTPSCYCPISCSSSFTCSMSKTFEKHVCSILYPYICILSVRLYKRQLVLINTSNWCTIQMYIWYISTGELQRWSKSNQGNQGYSGNQNNVIQGQRPDIENRHTQQRT